jgi:hypothetical protein
MYKYSKIVRGDAYYFWRLEAELAEPGLNDAGRKIIFDGLARYPSHLLALEAAMAAHRNMPWPEAEDKEYVLLLELMQKHSEITISDVRFKQVSQEIKLYRVEQSYSTPILNESEGMFSVPIYDRYGDAVLREFPVDSLEPINPEIHYVYVDDIAALLPEPEQPEASLSEWLNPEALNEIEELWEALSEKQRNHIHKEKNKGRPITKWQIDRATLKAFLLSAHAERKSTIPVTVIKTLSLKYTDSREKEGFFCDIVRQLSKDRSDQENANLSNKILYEKIRKIMGAK